LNADLLKLRDSKLFEKLPERAFRRVLDHVKARSFESGDEVLAYASSSEFKRYFGYVVSGRVIFVGDGNKPLGVAVRDEFFLGRAFSLVSQPVRKIVAAQERTLIVWIPKEIIESLATHAQGFSQIIEEIYDSLYERAEMIVADIQGAKHYEEWLHSPSADRTLSSWLEGLELEKEKKLARAAKAKTQRRLMMSVWGVAILATIFFGYESLVRYLERPWSLLSGIGQATSPFYPGSDFNIALGIAGYSLIGLTALHGVVKLGIRKLKWKVNYNLSLEFHMLLGLTGSFFVLYHTAFELSGANIAHYALYCLWIAVTSGLVGQLVSTQIPRSIRGEQLKLDSLKQEQLKLKQKAELLMDDHQYKTSIALLGVREKASFWEPVFSIPLMWARSVKVKQALKDLGLGIDSAKLAASLIRRELQMKQKIRSLEVANVVFKRWMYVHKPFGYLVYFLGAVHIIISMVLT